MVEMKTSGDILPMGFKEEDNVIYGISEGGLFHIVLNRPQKKNALSGGMSSKIVQLLEQASNKKDVKIVLFYGAGDFFSAGNDVS